MYHFYGNLHFKTTFKNLHLIGFINFKRRLWCVTASNSGNLFFGQVFLLIFVNGYLVILKVFLKCSKRRFLLKKYILQVDLSTFSMLIALYRWFIPFIIILNTKNKDEINLSKKDKNSIS